MSTPDALGMLNLMINEKKPAVVPDWADLLVLYAKRLHEVAPKLSDEEIQPLIAIGAATWPRRPTSAPVPCSSSRAGASRWSERSPPR